MADRSIGQLPEVTAMGVTDLFVLEQAGAAKKLTGQLLKASLMTWLDGHGGVKSFAYDEDTGKVTIVTTDGTTLTTGDLRGKNGHMIHAYDLGEPGSPGDYLIMPFPSANPMPEDWAVGDLILNSYGDMWVISNITPTDNGYNVRFDFMASLVGPKGDSPTIGSNGHWWVGDTDTGVVARGPTGPTGPQGTAPHIGANGHWYVGDVDTGVNAKGDKGDGLKIDGSVPTYADLPTLTAADMGKTYLVDADGRLYFWSGTAWPASGQGLLIKGEDGITPNIGANGHWWIGTTDTGVQARGEDGAPGTPGADGKSAYKSAQDGGYTGTETAFNALLAHVGSKVDKSTIVDVTLLAANWAGTEAPYTYTAAVEGVTTTSTQDWANGTNITAEQLAAWQAANIVDGGQGIGSVTFKAFGAKPEVDIPLRCILRRDT